MCWRDDRWIVGACPGRLQNENFVAIFIETFVGLGRFSTKVRIYADKRHQRHAVGFSV